eukprot:234962-Pleurochrysis_carterae.AAC.1
MLDIDYQGEYPSDSAVRQSSHGTWYLAVSRPTGNVVGDCEIRQYLRSSRHFYFWNVFSEIPDTRAWPPTEKALSQRPRRCGRSTESSWLSL